MEKAVKRRVTKRSRSANPGWCEGGTEEFGEHGLGAEMSIGRHFRVRPLLRYESSFSLTQKWSPRKGGWPLWGRGNAKPLAEFSAGRKWSGVACALTRNKVVPRQFLSPLGLPGRFFHF